MAPEDFARVAVMLNPRPGEPTTADSHVGGPLLWPADEPWPWCEGAAHYTTGDDIPEEAVVGVRTPFVGAAQLYRRDFPELPFPDGTDLLQVLLCTLYHDVREAWGPDVRLVWRDSTSVTELIDAPRPEWQEEDYVLTPNLLEPVRCTEYAMPPDRPEPLRDEEWPEVPHGSKAGGWTRWYNALPREMECPECGSVRRQTLALGGGEPSGHSIGWDLGRQANLNVFTCPQDVRHPIKVNLD
jgi:hypothetical protein